MQWRDAGEGDGREPAHRCEVNRKRCRGCWYWERGRGGGIGREDNIVKMRSATQRLQTLWQRREVYVPPQTDS